MPNCAIELGLYFKSYFKWSYIPQARTCCLLYIGFFLAVMDSAEEITSITENVIAANAWDAHFQKFPMLKLTLRLLTILSSESDPPIDSDLAESPDFSTPEHSKSDQFKSEQFKSEQFKSEQFKSRPSELDSPNREPYKSDGLGYIQQQIASVFKNLVEEFPNVDQKSHILKVKPPVVTPELDRLVTVISGVAKLHVAEVVSRSTQSITKTEGGMSSGQIEPRNVYEAFRQRDNEK